jgi:hypothetical protein
LSGGGWVPPGHLSGTQQIAAKFRETDRLEIAE